MGIEEAETQGRPYGARHAGLRLGSFPILSLPYIQKSRGGFARLHIDYTSCTISLSATLTFRSCRTTRRGLLQKTCMQVCNVLKAHKAAQIVKVGYMQLRYPVLGLALSLFTICRLPYHQSDKLSILHAILLLYFLALTSEIHTSSRSSTARMLRSFHTTAVTCLVTSHATSRYTAPKSTS